MADTKQPEALTLAQKLDNAPAWESQPPTIYGWNDSGETLAYAAAELRRLHSDNETLRCKLQTLEKLGAACDDVQLLRLGYAAARQEIESLKAKNLELERVCDATYVTQGADAYNHACSMMEQYQAERKAARKEVGTESSLCDGISWLYTRIASLESQLEAVGTGGWMRNGALLYRLTDERRPANFDEIRVTMANGSRDIGQMSAQAERLLVMLTAPQPAAPTKAGEYPPSSADMVMAALDTEEWGLERIQRCDYISDEGNREGAWLVKRQKAPYCAVYTDKPGAPYGPRSWSGPTALDALQKAADDLGIRLPQPAARGAAQAAPVDAERWLDLLAEARAVFWQPANAALCERLDAFIDAARAAQKDTND